MSIPRNFPAGTFRKFSGLAQHRSWTAQQLAARFRGRSDEPTEFLNRVLAGKSPDSIIVYRSILDLYFKAQTEVAFSQSHRVCACGCGREVFDRKKWAQSSCKKRVQRNSILQRQKCLVQVVDFLDPKPGQIDEGLLTR
jgi:hypothetical protein